MSRRQDSIEAEYVCGKCGTIVYYRVGSDAPNCPECGWQSKTKSQYDVPSELKFPIRI